MKITGFRTAIAQLPADEPLAGGPLVHGTRDFVTIEVETDQPGLVGVGLTHFGGPVTPALRHTVDLLAQMLVGDDPLRIEAAGEKLRVAAGASMGPGGMFTLALAAIDIALWDIKGKAFGVPVSVLAGSALAWWFTARAADGAGPLEASGCAMLATLAWLGVFEHLLMVLPLQPETLWRRAAVPSPRPEAVEPIGEQRP